MITDNSPSRLIITSGEPAGIGPDLIVKLFQQEKDLSHLTVLIDPELLQQRAEQLGIHIGKPNIVESDHDSGKQNSTTPRILSIKLRTPVISGELNTDNAPYLLDMLDHAVNGCLSGAYDAMVTGPLQKSVINDAGIAFSGHTEYLAKACGDAFPVMLLACPGLRVALATTHIPLSQVPEAITETRLERVIKTIMNDMRIRFGIQQPKIIICGLNPHAGEGGHLGHEEQTIIEPLITRLNNEGAKLIGPLPADTAFRQELRETADVYLAMYHDQGLPVLKTLGFGEAVNVTLGLPIIRTSVDHGTALALAGTGKAKLESLLAAIEMAEELTKK